MLRLFLMPFCVSSFSQLIKGKGFVLVFPPDLHENRSHSRPARRSLLFVWIVRRLTR